MRRAAASALRLAGLFLIGLGLVAAVETLRIKDDWSGARLLPAAVALALLALGAAHLRIAPTATLPAAPDPGSAAAARRGTARLTVVLTLLVAYVAGLPALGFLPATAILMVVLVRGLGGYRWSLTLGLGLGLALAAHVVFRVWLGMPLPDGLLGR